MSTPSKRGFGATMIAVAWSFVGLRRKRDFDQDVDAMNPLYVVGAGLIGVAVLVATLISIVRMVVNT